MYFVLFFTQLPTIEKNMKKNIALLILLFSCFSGFCQPMNIEVNGTTSFGQTQNLVTEAGNDFPSTLESETAVDISVVFNNFWDKKDNPNEKWSINVQKSDIQWDPNLVLQIKRNGSGTTIDGRNTTVIYDGENYMEVTDTPVYFFRGKSEIYYIPLSLRLDNISVTMGAKNFETNIILTVYADW